MRRTLRLLSTMVLAILLAGGVALAASTVVIKTFTTSAAISILSPPDASPPTAANPYPSAISVSGFNAGSTIRDVNLKLSGFTHPAPKDVDIILQHGTPSAIVMSDVGCFSVFVELGLTLDDEAANAVPDDCAAPLTSGSYQPVDYDTVGQPPQAVEDATFPSPANTLPTDASALSVFDGTDPNGTWNLFVVDDAAGNAGQFAGGWSLEITADSPDNIPPTVVRTSPATISTTANVTATFSEDMDASDTDGDPSTITGTTFKLLKLNADGSTTRVTATVTYAAATKKAKLDPSSNLKSGRTYKATVTSGAQDLAGNALDQKPDTPDNQSKSWKFTVQ
jgi:hypothetical protein